MRCSAISFKIKVLSVKSGLGHTLELIIEKYAYALDGLEVELEQPELQSRLDLTNGREIEQKELGTAQRYLRIGHLRLQDLGLLLLGGQHGQELLDALLVDDCAVHFDDSCFDDARRRQGRHADHDHVGALGVQNCDLLLALASFL